MAIRGLCVGGPLDGTWIMWSTGEYVAARDIGGAFEEVKYKFRGGMWVPEGKTREWALKRVLDCYARHGNSDT